MWAFIPSAGLNSASASEAFSPMMSTPWRNTPSVPAIVELLAHAVEKNAFSRRAVRLGQRLPGLWLRRLDPGDEVGG
jgi:hypothetical protein